MRFFQWSFISFSVFLSIKIMYVMTKAPTLGAFQISLDGKELGQNKNHPEILPELKSNIIQKVCFTKKCNQTAEYISKNMNRNVLPCHNFYEFACGNYRTWNRIPEDFNRVNVFRAKINSLFQESLDAIKTKIYENDTPSIKKAQLMFESCMDEATIEQLGELPIPIELNSVGLQIESPFHDSVDQSSSLSKLLGRMHRHAVFSKFLFSVEVKVDQTDLRKNRFAFDYTPAVIKFLEK